jgi:hypothetical protein
MHRADSLMNCLPRTTSDVKRTRHHENNHTCQRHRKLWEEYFRSCIAQFAIQVVFAHTLQ